MSDKEFMQRAIDLSREKMQSNCGGPFGAVIVKNGEIIGEGWNCVTSKNDPTAHAEVQAIRNACSKLDNYDLSGCAIYTSCEPCPMCLSAIYWARLDKVYYGNTRYDAAKIEFDDELIYREVGTEIDKRQIPMVNFQRDEANTVFQEWESKSDKVPY